MAERELPSDSEESDGDYIPSGDEGQLSEEESDGGVEEGRLSGEEDETSSGDKKRRKRKGTKTKKGGKKRKITRASEPDKEENDDVKPDDVEETEEELKKKADALWAFFKMDTAPSKPKPAPSSAAGSSKETKTEFTSSNKPKETIKKEEKVPEKIIPVTKTFHFAGEEVKVTEEVKVSEAPCTDAAAAASKMKFSNSGCGIPSRCSKSSGLAGMIGQLNKKNKLSTLEKSKLDWESFKKSNDLTEEIQTHNRGKHGYLEKQDFLQRADLRQFEIEKQLRANTRRSNR